MGNIDTNHYCKSMITITYSSSLCILRIRIFHSQQVDSLMRTELQLLKQVLEKKKAKKGKGKKGKGKKGKEKNCHRN